MRKGHEVFQHATFHGTAQVKVQTVRITVPVTSTLRVSFKRNKLRTILKIFIIAY